MHYFRRAVLERLVPAGWYVDSQEPITTADSEPEPDVIVAHGNIYDYLDHHPSPEELALVVEVADAPFGAIRASKSNFMPKPTFLYIGSLTFPNSSVKFTVSPQGQQKSQPIINTTSITYPIPCPW